METAVARYLATQLNDDRIERRTKTGAKDRGDISGLRHHGARLVIEVKDCARMALGEWVTEAETERGNDDALAGITVHKRVRRGDMGDQYVTMTLRDLVALLTGARPEEDA